MDLNYSTLSNIPITLGQKTPDVLKKSSRLRNDESYNEFSSRLDYNPYTYRRGSDQPGFASQTLTQAAPFYTNPVVGDGLTSYSRTEYQTRNASKQQYESPSFVRSYEPLQKTSFSQFTNLYPSTGLETFTPRSHLLESIINISQYINGAIIFGTSFVFLYLNLSLINYWMEKSEFTFSSFEFIKIFLILIAILFSKGLMLRPYDEFINWSDILKRLFTRVSFLNLGLFINFVAMIAFTFDIFSFLAQSKISEENPSVIVSEEISQIIIISILNRYNFFYR